MIPRDPRSRRGFTLIEVLGALLIYSAGLLMMLGLTRALSRSMERSAVGTLVTAEGEERMDSLSAVAYASLTVGSRTDTVSFRGVQYSRVQTVSQYSPLVKRVIVTLAPLAGVGPTYDGTSYLSDPW